MTPGAASDGKIKAADLLFVGGADVKVAQKCPAHFVSQFGVGAPVVAGSGKKTDVVPEKKQEGEAGGKKNQLKTYLGKI